MTCVSECWSNREKRAEQAIKHTEKMEREYGERIKESIQDTVCYSLKFECTNCRIKDVPTKIIIDDIDSVSAVMKYQKVTEEGRMAVLNFSSYKNPGGMFLNGSKAQEECLCHESFLYNVLSKNQGFYEWNNQHKNKSLYLDRGLYSPNILFMRYTNGIVINKYCDVITCAAPNKSAASKYQNVSAEENTEALKSRIKFVLDIAKRNNVETLILGAYGCGVFGQDPKEVAEIFKGYLNSSHKGCFYNVVFAIPDGKDRNLEAFREIFEGKNSDE
jgi:uncharacterized protein (TIGR02452 family)